MSNKHLPQHGIGTVEIMTAVALAAIFFTAIYGAVNFSVRTVGKNVRLAEALYLAEEGMEAVRFMKNESWAANIAPIAVGTVYYPVISLNEWTLTTVNPGPVNGVYTRTVTVYTVLRDASDDIAAAGTADAGTRLVKVQVDWTETGGVPQSVTLETYSTNFLNN